MKTTRRPDDDLVDSEVPPGEEYRAHVLALLPDDLPDNQVDVFEAALARLDVEDPYEVLALQRTVTRLYEGDEAYGSVDPETIEAEAEWWSLAAELRRGVEVERGKEIIERLREIDPRVREDRRPPSDRTGGLSLPGLVRTRLRGHDDFQQSGVDRRRSLYRRLAVLLADEEVEDPVDIEDPARPLVSVKKGLVTFRPKGRAPGLFYTSLVEALSAEFDTDAPRHKDGSPNRDLVLYRKRASALLAPFFPRAYVDTSSRGLLDRAFERA